MRPGISHIVRISHCFPKIALPIGLSRVFLSTVHLLDVFKTYTPLLPNSTHKVARSDFCVILTFTQESMCNTHYTWYSSDSHACSFQYHGGCVFSIFIPLCFCTFRLVLSLFPYVFTSAHHRAKVIRIKNFVSKICHRLTWSKCTSFFVNSD